MAGFVEAPAYEQFYCTTDPIQNLKIRIKIFGASDLKKLPQDLSLIQKANKSDFSIISGLFQNEIGNKEIYWQKKILSQKEYEKCKDKNNYLNAIESTYHNIILKQGIDATNIIFTYIENDQYTINKQNECIKMTTSNNENPTFHVRNRFQNDLGISKDFIRIKDPKEDIPESKEYTTMYIMIDLACGNPVEIDQPSELELCEIRYYGDGQLSILPDFNGNRPPYKINSGTSGVLAYIIEHSSIQPSKRENEFEMKLYKSLYSNHVRHLSSLVGYTFEMPPHNSIKIMCCGEIISVTNFEFDHFIVNYVVDLTDGWSVRDPKTLSGSTQISKTKKTSDHRKVAYFSSPFQFELIFISNLFGDASNRWPRMLYEVQSIDSWGRIRTEGYGTSIISYIAGINEFDVNCFRPKGNDNLSELRRFFIGGAAEIDDITTASIPSDFKGEKLNKYSLQTVSTGKIKIRFQQIQQISQKALEGEQKAKENAMLHFYRAGDNYTSIFQAIETFRQLRKKMLSIRENISLDATNLTLA